mmetsp:Transcript_18/g.53  ORF Transcript_18/g.53 Transcript_18/m.53 type:complete len:224 (+) Transcript_18:1068-1739(+)
MDRESLLEDASAGHHAEGNRSLRKEHQQRPWQVCAAQNLHGRAQRIQRSHDQERSLGHLPMAWPDGSLEPAEGAHREDVDEGYGYVHEVRVQCQERGVVVHWERLQLRQNRVGYSGDDQQEEDDCQLDVLAERSAHDGQRRTDDGGQVVFVAMTAACMMIIVIILVVLVVILRRFCGRRRSFLEFQLIQQQRPCQWILLVVTMTILPVLAVVRHAVAFSLFRG